MKVKLAVLVPLEIIAAVKIIRDDECPDKF
jgi:hypothetical protein